VVVDDGCTVAELVIVTVLVAASIRGVKGASGLKVKFRLSQLLPLPVPHTQSSVENSPGLQGKKLTQPPIVTERCLVRRFLGKSHIYWMNKIAPYAHSTGQKLEVHV
jgi:hypothetical protein